MEDNTVVQAKVHDEAEETQETCQSEATQEEMTSAEASTEEVQTSEAEQDVVAEQDTDTQDEAALETEAVKDDEKLDAVVRNLAELSAKMDEMNHLFVQKIQHTTHEEKIVDQMHAELQKYKEDMYAKLVRPILLDIIEVRDSIQRMSKSYAEKGGENPTIPLKVFSDYAYDIQDILEKNDITIYQGQAGEAFSPIRQRALKKVTTPVEELHGKIAESLSCGYEYQGKTISPEKVVVFFYEKPVDTEGENK